VTFREALRDAGAELRAAGCSSPQVDAELLLAKAVGTSRTAFFTEPERELGQDEEAAFRAMVARRVTREPVAYILGEWGFRSLTLLVDARALVPRPETEIVVEHCLAHLRELEEPFVLDVGTGSGAIALAIAVEAPAARVVATDISSDALALAAENRARAGLADRLELVLGHLVAGMHGPFDLVVSNPPYVLPDEFDSLEPEVRLYEPYEAIVGSGQTEAIARRAREVLRPGGWLVLESSEYRAQEVAATLRALGYGEVAVADDLTGRERAVEGRLRTGVTQAQAR
jgi:release factor glutamine methyltransferase